MSEPEKSARTIEREERERLEAEFRARLASVDLDGPFDFPKGGGLDFAAMFGGAEPRGRFAVCLRCGSMVVLGDPEERPDGSQVERGVRLHTFWHQELGR